MNTYTNNYIIENLKILGKFQRKWVIENPLTLISQKDYHFLESVQKEREAFRNPLLKILKIKHNVDIKHSVKKKQSGYINPVSRG